MVIILAFLLVIPLVGSLPANSEVYAENNELPSITVESKTIHRGQTFTVAVTLDKNPGLKSMRLFLEYDKNAMNLIGFEKGSALGSHTFTPTNPDTEQGYDIDFVFLWDGEKDLSTGEILILEFQSNIEASVGEYIVNLRYDKQNTTTDYGQTTDVEIKKGVITYIVGEFKVQYLDYDKTVLFEKDCYPNEIPAYPYENPTRPDDAMYYYEFSGWKGFVSSGSVVCYIAQYSTTPKEYEVEYYVDGVFYTGDLYDYDSYVDLTIMPSKKNHNFSGWFLDEEYTQRVTVLKMPARDIKLYGYMKYNVREENIPKIVLSLDEIVADVACVDVSVVENSGLSGFVLTLTHNKDGLEFIGYERGEAFQTFQLITTNTENGFNIDPFKFYFDNGPTNGFETGSILKLKFKLKENVPAGLYDVMLTYNEETDAKYLQDGEVWYSKLNIEGTKVPLGRIFKWEEETDGGIKITVETKEGLSPETVLIVKRITHKFDLSDELILSVAGEDMELKDIYSVALMRDGVEVEPLGGFTVKIQLTKDQKNSRVIKLFKLEENNTLVEHDSNIEIANLVFEAEKSSNWAIIGTKTSHVRVIAPRNATILIVSLCLLNIATVSLLLIIKVRLRKKQKTSST